MYNTCSSVYTSRNTCCHQSCCVSLWDLLFGNSGYNSCQRVCRDACGNLRIINGKSGCGYNYGCNYGSNYSYNYGCGYNATNSSSVSDNSSNGYTCFGFCANTNGVTGTTNSNGATTGSNGYGQCGGQRQRCGCCNG